MGRERESNGRRERESNGGKGRDRKGARSTREGVSLSSLPPPLSSGHECCGRGDTRDAAEETRGMRQRRQIFRFLALCHGDSADMGRWMDGMVDESREREPSEETTSSRYSLEQLASGRTAGGAKVLSFFYDRKRRGGLRAWQHESRPGRSDTLDFKNFTLWVKLWGEWERRSDRSGEASTMGIGRSVRSRIEGKRSIF